MKVSHWFFVAAIVSLSTATFATSSYDDGPLYPGSILIAGDLSRNEFYILGRDEAKPTKPVTVKMASSKIKSERNIKLASALKAALPAKVPAQKKQTMTSTPSMLAVKGKNKPNQNKDLVPKIDTVLHQASYRTISHKTLPILKKQATINKKMKSQIASKKPIQPLRIKVTLHAVKVQKAQHKKIHSQFVAMSKQKTFKPVFKEYKDIVKVTAVAKKPVKVKVAKARSKAARVVTT